MDKSDKISAIITGIFLFAVAALFSISEIFGVLSAGGGALQRFGAMLISVYGISSICIPAFFFVAGCFCFGAKWSVQKISCLMISALPFLTLVFSERASRSIAANDSSPIAIVKIVTLMVIAFLLVAVEYLVTLVVAGHVQKKNGCARRVKNVHQSDDEFDADEIVIGGVETVESDSDFADEDDVDATTRVDDADEIDEDDVDAEISSMIDSRVEKATDDSDWSLADILKQKRKEIEKVAQVQEQISESIKTSGANEETKAADNTFNDPWNVVRNSGALENTNAEETVLTTETLNSDPWNVTGPTNVSGVSDNKDLKKEIILKDESEENVAGVENAATAESTSKAQKNAAGTEDSVSDDVPLAAENVPDSSEDFSDEDDIIAEFERGNMENEIDFEMKDEEEDTDENEESDDFLTEELDEMFTEREEDSPEAEDDITFSDETEDMMSDFEIIADDDDAAEDDAIEEDIAEEPEVKPVPEPAAKEEKKTLNKKSPLESVFARMDKDIKNDLKNKKNVPATENASDSAAVEKSTGAEKSSVSTKVSEEPRAVHTDEKGNTKPIAVPPKKPKPRHTGPYKIPTDLLTAYDENPYWIIDAETTAAAENLKNTLKEFKIEAEVTGIKKGPVVTMFEILPAPGVKLSKIVALQDNIALRLAASSVRIVAPIPGKHAVGIEVPNKDRAIISMRECLELDRPEWKKMAVPVILGKDIQGDAQIIDLAKTPHLLIAGSTGAGKSVCVNSMILSILYKRSPNEVKMILIDPKIVELKLYNDIPHLLTPVITEPKRAMQSLQYCLCEMERRYALLDHLGVRDISSYNKKIVEKGVIAEKLPYLIVIIDEFADLMATTGKQLEGVLARLAAMSRAVGIHLVLATQRPSIDVITGLIKANIPSRIAFMVASKMDSRIIIDQVGAEKLLGKGDMLYASATDPFPVRIQGTFVSDQEVEDVVEKVKEWGEPEYIDDEIFVDDDDEDGDQMSLFNAEGDDPLYEKALEIVVQTGKASASYIQRKLKIGYNRAARLVEEMEERGIVGPANGSKPRELLHVPS